MNIKFKKSHCVTEVNTLEYNQWYQFTTKWLKNHYALIRRIDERSFFVIYHDGSTNSASESSLIKQGNFTAMPVDLDISVL